MYLWKETQNINKYTGEPNKYLRRRFLHAVVFCRQRCWAYTVRAVHVSGDWIQQSSKRQWLETEEIAQTEAILAMDSLEHILKNTPLIMPPPDFEPREDKLDELREMMTRRLQRLGLTS